MTAGLMVGAPLTARAAERLRKAAPTPNEAIDMLKAGNERFIFGNVQPDDLASTRKRLVDGQAPFAIVLRCADSRVSPEIVFDQGLGDLFVCAVAGNIPTAELVASMEYAIAILGSPLIVVMGHSGCGAVDAAIQNFNSVDALPGSLPGLISQILPAVIATRDTSGDALANATRTNVSLGMARLSKMSNIIDVGVKDGSLKIIGGVYEMSSGRFVPVEG
jgi:carbonic anhydrase